MNGHVGKILSIDLTNHTTETIPTAEYEDWVGGFGMGLALVWDQIDKDYITDTHDKTGFEPENVLAIMSGPLQGTLAPNAGRTEVTGLAPEAYPRPQLTRSNFGGRFSPMMKFAGYDGVVITGQSDDPVYVEIQNSDVRFRDASHLIGLGARETQEEIWREFGVNDTGAWKELEHTQGSGQTTQRPAIVTTGQAGDNQLPIGCLMHDSGNAAGQGGFGGVFGSKNLKAISVIGTNGVEVAHPDKLFETRSWLMQYEYDIQEAESKHSASFEPGWAPGSAYSYIQEGYDQERFGRPLGCFACPINCRENLTTDLYAGGESQCVELGFYLGDDISKHGEPTDAQHVATGLLNDYGINAYELSTGLPWLKSLYKRDILGEGKEIHTELDFDDVGSREFVENLLGKIINEEGIGNALAGGLTRAAKEWGMYEHDVMEGILPQTYWLGETHHGHTINWAYESILGVRDINAHDVDAIADMDDYFPKNVPSGEEYSAAEAAKRFAELAPPWHEERMLDFSEDNVYSEHMAKTVSWHRRYTNFWKNSAQFCDWWSPSFFNSEGPKDEYSPGKGISPEAEERFFYAVTGRDVSWADGLEIGRRIWNLERAMLVMHGRHRDEEYFPPFEPYDSYIHTDETPYIQGNEPGADPTHHFPVYKDGEWKWEATAFPLEKEGLDEWKSTYYKLEGWDPGTGRPTRETLESLNLKGVADELEARGRLPATAPGE